MKVTFLMQMKELKKWFELMRRTFFFFVSEIPHLPRGQNYLHLFLLPFLEIPRAILPSTACKQLYNRDN